MKLIFLGAPGAGKGTQAEIIAAELKIPTISTGNIIREALANGTEMGLKAKSFIEAGKLVPDDVVIGIIKDRLAADDCNGGFILDGFPRTIPQAEALDKMGVIIDKVVDIDVPDENIVNRMSGRRVCKACGSSYHIENKKPKVEGVCDVCGGELYIRKDDNVDALKVRLEAYHSQTQPLINYYAQYGLIGEVNGDTSLENVFKAIVDLIEGDK